MQIIMKSGEMFYLYPFYKDYQDIHYCCYFFTNSIKSFVDFLQCFKLKTSNDNNKTNKIIVKRLHS